MKTKHLYIFMLVALGLVSCQQKEEEQIVVQVPSQVLKVKANPQSIPEGSAFTKSKTDAIVQEILDTKHDFKWEYVDLKTRWSAAQFGDQSVAIGYKPANYGSLAASIHQINIQEGEWKKVHDELILFIINELNKTAMTPVKWADILIEDDPQLPILTIRLTDKNTFTALFNLENVRYIEPMDYWPDQVERSSSGCSAATAPLNSADWTVTTPNCLVPWNYNLVNIPSAWNVAQGQGVTIGVIDAGISNSQFFLSTLFNSGSSNVGRSITTDYTLGTSAFTSCTHGTSMCGLATAPRNSGLATTGVAYKSSLHFIRACDDVVLDASSEKTAVKNALVRMGNKANVKIISMSIGTPFSSSVLEDGVNYANNMGKLIFAAAGTSFSWTSWWGVIYPASYAACVAVTGVQENGNTCETCHDGSEVAFTIPMERNSNTDRNSLSLPAAGSTPTYIGGSSCATATAAGIAALVWSSKSTLTKAQVYTAMRNTAQYYPVKTSSHGYGNLNALGAVNAALTY